MARTSTKLTTIPTRSIFLNLVPFLSLACCLLYPSAYLQHHLLSLLLRMKRPRAHMTGHAAAVGDTRTAEGIVSAAGECSVRVGGEDMYAVRPAMLYHHEGTITRDPGPILNWRSLQVSIPF